MRSFINVTPLLSAVSVQPTQYLQVHRHEFKEGGSIPCKVVGGRRDSKNTNIWKRWGVHDPTAPMVALPLSRLLTPED